MKIVRNKYIPFTGYKAVLLFGILFVKSNAKIDDVTMNHESVHSRQYVEVGILSLVLLLPLVFNGLWWLWLILSVFAFYILYVTEWVIRFISYTVGYISRKLRDKYRKYNPHLAYKRISIEKEAYKNEMNLEYLRSRKIFSWIKYL